VLKKTKVVNSELTIHVLAALVKKTRRSCSADEFNSAKSAYKGIKRTNMTVKRNPKT